MENPINHKNPNSPLLRPSEVAEVLKISKGLAYRLLQQGQIPTIRFNRTVRVRQADLEAFINRSSSNKLQESE
jgi:excisionase family DNA binding protein